MNQSYSQIPSIYHFLKIKHVFRMLLRVSTCKTTKRTPPQDTRPTSPTGTALAVPVRLPARRITGFVGWEWLMDLVLEVNYVLKSIINFCLLYALYE